MKIFPFLRFRLAGVVHYQSAHFVAYCLRSGGNWLKCDDLQPKIQSRINPKTTVVCPQIAIYVLEQKKEWNHKFLSSHCAFMCSRFCEVFFVVFVPLT